MFNSRKNKVILSTSLIIGLSIFSTNAEKKSNEVSEDFILNEAINKVGGNITFNKENKEAIVHVNKQSVLIKSQNFYGIKDNIIIPNKLNNIANINIPTDSKIIIENNNIYSSKEFFELIINLEISNANLISEKYEVQSNGKVYPDGWTAPVLKSSWNSNHKINLATLENELGFKDNGMSYGIEQVPTAIQVIGNSPSSPYEVNLMFLMWGDNANGIIKDAYRIPVVAKELFTLYFGNDATKVWNYFNKNDIPDDFTANGRKVHTNFDVGTGALTLEVGKLNKN